MLVASFLSEWRVLNETNDHCGSIWHRLMISLCATLLAVLIKLVDRVLTRAMHNKDCPVCRAALAERKNYSALKSGHSEAKPDEPKKIH